MLYYETSQEWLKQSTLLFQAYPTSSRVTTKYTIHPVPSPESRKRKRKETRPTIAHANGTDQTTDAPAATTQPKSASAPAIPTSTPAPEVPKASLTLKTYDPVSGVCLKYRTEKAAEVGRLIASLGRLGKHMAASPDAGAVDETEKALEVSGDVDGTDKQAVQNDAAVIAPAAPEGDSKSAQQGKSGGGGASGKKKKKGKK